MMQSKMPAAEYMDCAKCVCNIIIAIIAKMPSLNGIGFSWAALR